MAVKHAFCIPNSFPRSMQLRHIRKYEENDSCDYPPDISLHPQTELTEMKEDLGKFRCGTLNFIVYHVQLYCIDIVFIGLEHLRL